jgi:hypothetical protein
MAHKPNPQHLPPLRSAEEYERKITEMRAVLAYVQWSQYDGYCPVCGGSGPNIPHLERHVEGHSSRCALGVLIHE